MHTSINTLRSKVTTAGALTAASLSLGACGSSEAGPSKTPVPVRSTIENKSKDPNVEAKYVATTLGNRAIKLYKDTKAKKIKNVEVSAEISKPSENRKDTSITIDIDTKRSNVAGYSGKYSVYALFTTKKDLHTTLNGKNAQHVRISEAYNEEQDTNPLTSINILRESDDLGWQVRGYYDTKAGDQVIAGGATNFEEIPLTAAMSDKFGNQMLGMIDDALAGKPTDYMTPPPER